MQKSQGTILHSLIRGILFAAIFCLLFTGGVGAEPYLNIAVVSDTLPEYPATAVLTFSSDASTELRVNFGDGTAETPLNSASQTLSHTYASPGIYTVWLNTTVDGNLYSTSKDIVVKPYSASESITITSAQNLYYLLEPFTISGENTYSNSVRLYFEGANLQFMQITENPISVSEGRWSFVIDTFAISQKTRGLDSGTYNFYAVVGEDEITSSEQLAETKYSVIQIVLEQPTLTLTSSSNSITSESSVVITGIARGAESIQYYLFGTEKVIAGTVPVGNDYTFRIEIPTTGFESGEYYAVIQHPMYDKAFNIYSKENNGAYDFYLKFTSASESEFLFSTLDKYAKSAYLDLCEALTRQNIDDLYQDLTILVTSSTDTNGFITINSVSVDGAEGTIQIGGVNTAGTYVYLYSKPSSGNTVCLTEHPISCDNSRWVGTIPISSLTGTGGYDIYAVSSNSQSAPVISEITHGKYDTYDLDQFITVSISPETAVNGDDVYILGKALGTLVVQYFVSGTDYFDCGLVVTNTNGEFTIPLDYPIFQSEKYDILVQHPGTDTVFNLGPLPSANGEYDIVTNLKGSYDIPGYSTEINTGNRNKMYVVPAICNILESLNSDDLYAMTSFTFGSKSEDVSQAESITLTPGWNFISVPNYLDASCDTAGELFASLDTDGMSHLGYDAKTGWHTLKAETPIKPLDGYWVYSKTAKTLSLAYSADINVPPTKTVYKGWNAVGLSAETSMTAKSAFSNLNWVRCIPWDVEKGKWGTVIVKGGSTENSEELKLKLGNGNWLYVESDGTYIGNTA